MLLSIASSYPLYTAVIHDDAASTCEICDEADLTKELCDRFEDRQNKCCNRRTYANALDGVSDSGICTVIFCAKRHRAGWNRKISTVYSLDLTSSVRPSFTPGSSDFDSCRATTHLPPSLSLLHVPSLQHSNATPFRLPPLFLHFPWLCLVLPCEARPRTERWLGARTLFR